MNYVKKTQIKYQKVNYCQNLEMKGALCCGAEVKASAFFNCISSYIITVSSYKVKCLFCQK